MSDDDRARFDLMQLAEVAQRMGETFELEPLLRTIENAGRAALGCERATVFLHDPATGTLVSKVATGTGEIRIPIGQGIAGEAARLRSVIVVPDAYADPRFNPQVDHRTGYRTRNLLTLPLTAPDGELIGVLQVLNKIDGPFTPQDELLAAALGALTGVAVKRQVLLDQAAAKQRMERDLNIARDIQRRLLPKSDPRLPGFDIAGWNLPADQTGGDCYDFHILPGDRLGVLVADATGHGIGPALIVSQCRAVFRAFAQAGGDPAVIAARVNALMCADLPADRFVTCFFGVLDAARATLHYVSAGQGPLWHYRAAEDRVDERPATCLPIGIMPDMPVEAGEPVVFAPGDVFLLLTDGFIEWAREDGEQYGAGRLVDLVRRHHHLPSAELIRRIHEDVRAFAGPAPQGDDLTAVLIRRTA